ncbi:MAG: STAS domain-containing protein [Planctomycetes bacterium]|nr:STAS domain-containing protein [Planctomycetota bacterium]
MPRSLVPVVVPVRYADSPVAEEVRLEVVAETANEAIETAQLLVEHWLRVSRSERPGAAGFGQALADIGDVPGAHAYVFAPQGLEVLQLPSRFDSENGERLGEAFAALDEHAIAGVVLDCSALTYINTVGLTGIAAHLKRLRIHLISVPPAIARVFDIVGMTTFLNVHVTLREALEAIPDRS